MKRDFIQLQIQEFQPSQVLDEFVKRILYGYADAPKGKILVVPPSGKFYLSYFHVGSHDFQFSDHIHVNNTRIFIGGQLYHESPVLFSDRAFGTLGFQFHPTAFYKLFHQDAADFTDRIIDFKEVNESMYDEILDAIGKHEDLETAVEVISAVLSKLIPGALKTPLADQAVGIIDAASGRIRMEKLAEQLSVDIRKLNREFIRAVGIAPKYYAKTIQLNHAVDLIRQKNTEKLNHLALDCGYFDQSHFIRDFQKFLGMSPLKFIRSDDFFLKTYLGKVKN